MADIDIDPFGEHNKTDSHPDGETIPLPLIIPGGGFTWEPEREQEMLFGGEKTQERRLTDSYVNNLYKELSKHHSRTADATCYNNFRCEGMQLYFKGRYEPLTNEDGKLRTFGRLKNILGKNRLHDLSFDMPRGKVTA